MISVVLGAAFGDEGKGQVTYALCEDYKRQGKLPIVVRFSGGQQAGHTVTTKSGLKHVFSCFGSGTFAGCSTLWLDSCVMDPVQWMIEKAELEEGLEVNIPIQFFLANVMVTTPFDVIHNSLERAGFTVGKGVWETVKRNQDGVHLFVGDLKFPNIVEHKLNAIQRYYTERAEGLTINRYLNVDIHVLAERYKQFSRQIHVFSRNEWIDFKDLIYEGSQGILLDPKYGAGNTFTTPISCIPSTLLSTSTPLNIYLVYRSYLTRHGFGGVPGSFVEPINITNPHETNVKNDFQGEFKTYPFSQEIIEYSRNCVRRELGHFEPNIYHVETCTDICEGHPSYNYIPCNSPDFDTLICRE